MTVAMQSLEEQAPLIHQNNGMLGTYESSGPLFKRSGHAEISIVVTEHPSSTFYKDEGGKSNHMTASAVMQLMNSKNSSKKQSLPFGSLTLKPKLVYESGNDVEDADEIFKVLSIEPECVNTTGQAVTVKFRIEKVSRRKDGKRFKVRFDVDYDKSSQQYASCDIQQVTTEPVVVLSKRKNSVNSVGSQPKSLSKKRLKASKNDDKSSAKDAKGIAQIHASLKTLEKKMTQLHERVALLESENKTLRSRLSEDFALESLSEYQAMASLAEQEDDRKTRSTSSRVLKVDDSSWDDGVYMLKYEDETSNQLKQISRNKSNEGMNFDFGLPSASFGPRSYLAE